MTPPRYLVPFAPKATAHRFTDVLVVGAGIAGLRAALAVPPPLDVLVVTKDRISESNSSYAQGGIAGVLAPEDRFENHVEDTLAAGAGLCDRAVVELVVRDAPKAIHDLIAWGTQFHPTVLYVAGSARFLITEAIRGEGAYLRDRDGHRFMPAVDPRAERATRDVVARAIFATMERTQHPNVYLDLSHLDPEHVRLRFPGIAKVCAGFGLDITRDRIPVRPGAHYMVGGVTVDMQGRTTLPGMWAAGEVTSSGLHGAIRLASNSLLEGLVFGDACGRGAAAAAERTPDAFAALPLRSPPADGPQEALDVADITNSLRSLMVRTMGIVRDRARLLEAKESVAFWCRYVL